MFEAYYVTASDDPCDIVGFACEYCADDGAECCGSVGECDSPQHCECGRPLDHSLTGVGMEYVLESIRETLQDGRDKYLRVMPLKGTGEESLTWYHGSPHVAIVRDWAEHLQWCNLTPTEDALVTRFLDWTEYQAGKRGLLVN